MRRHFVGRGTNCESAVHSHTGVASYRSFLCIQSRQRAARTLVPGPAVAETERIEASAALRPYPQTADISAPAFVPPSVVLCSRKVRLPWHGECMLGRSKASKTALV